MFNSICDNTDGQNLQQLKFVALGYFGIFFIVCPISFVHFNIAKCATNNKQDFLNTQCNNRDTTNFSNKPCELQLTEFNHGHKLDGLNMFSNETSTLGLECNVTESVLEICFLL